MDQLIGRFGPFNWMQTHFHVDGRDLNPFQSVAAKNVRMFSFRRLKELKNRLEWWILQLHLHFHLPDRKRERNLQKLFVQLDDELGIPFLWCGLPELSRIPHLQRNLTEAMTIAMYTRSIKSITDIIMHKYKARRRIGTIMGTRIRSHRSLRLLLVSS